MSSAQTPEEYQAMLDAFERFDPDPYPKTHRAALELLVDEDLHYELKESLGVSDLLPGGSPEKLRRMIAIANDFARLHKDAIAEGEMLGQERDKCSLIGELRSLGPHLLTRRSFKDVS